MTKKLSEQIHQYFDLMEQIRSQLYRVLPVSDRYLCVISFSTQLQALQCVLVSKVSLMEAKLIEGLTGQELVTYGQYLQTAEQWVANGMQEDYPFPQDKDVYAEYRSLTRDEAQPEPEGYEDEDEDDDTDGFETTQEYVESLSKSEALAKVSTYGIPHLFSLADAWGFEKSTDVAAMQSLAKGYILRTFP